MSVEVDEIARVESERAEKSGDNPESAQEKRRKIVDLATIQARANAYKNGDLVEHYEPELDAVFMIKPLTGYDMDRAYGLAKDNPDELGKFMALIAVKQPRMTLALWNELNGLSPTVRGRLLQAIREASGMGDDSLKKQSPDSLLTDGESSDGTDSPPNWESL